MYFCHFDFGEIFAKVTEDQTDRYVIKFVLIYKFRFLGLQCSEISDNPKFVIELEIEIFSFHHIGGAVCKFRGYQLVRTEFGKKIL